MEQGLAIALFAGVLALASWFVHGHAIRRPWEPMKMAFALVVVFLVSGSIGLEFTKPPRFVQADTRPDRVIWWEVGSGLAIMPLATYFWHKATRDVDRRTRRA